MGETWAASHPQLIHPPDLRLFCWICDSLVKELLSGGWGEGRGVRARLGGVASVPAIHRGVCLALTWPHSDQRAVWEMGSGVCWEKQTVWLKTTSLSPPALCGSCANWVRGRMDRLVCSASLVLFHFCLQNELEVKSWCRPPFFLASSRPAGPKLASAMGFWASASQKAGGLKVALKQDCGIKADTKQEALPHPLMQIYASAVQGRLSHGEGGTWGLGKRAPPQFKLKVCA